MPNLDGNRIKFNNVTCEMCDCILEGIERGYITNSSSIRDLLGGNALFYDFTISSNHICDRADELKLFAHDIACVMLGIIDKLSTVDEPIPNIGTMDHIFHAMYRALHVCYIDLTTTIKYAHTQCMRQRIYDAPFSLLTETKAEFHPGGLTVISTMIFKPMIPTVSEILEIPHIGNKIAVDIIKHRDNNVKANASDTKDEQTTEKKEEETVESSAHNDVNNHERDVAFNYLMGLQNPYVCTIVQDCSDAEFIKIIQHTLEWQRKKPTKPNDEELLWYIVREIITNYTTELSISTNINVVKAILYKLHVANMALSDDTQEYIVNTMFDYRVSDTQSYDQGEIVSLIHKCMRACNSYINQNRIQPVETLEYILNDKTKDAVQKIQALCGIHDNINIVEEYFQRIINTTAKTLGCIQKIWELGKHATTSQLVEAAKWSHELEVYYKVLNLVQGYLHAPVD